MCPLQAVLGFTWLNSLATSVTFNGIFFIAYIAFPAFKANPALNFGLGVLMGVTYVVGALAAGPVLKLLGTGGRLTRRLTHRRTLVLIMLLMAAFNCLPVAAVALAGGKPADASWSVWVFIAAYSPLSGFLWPLVEAYLSGGREGGALRRATGKFNVTWSSAAFLAFWAVVPFQRELSDPSAPTVAETLFALAPLTVMSLVQLVSIALLGAFPTAPAAHGPVAAAPVSGFPPVYRALLAAHRVLLPVAYLVMYALLPVLPTLLASVGVVAGGATAAASMWPAVRVASFMVLERWRGWVGTWVPALAGSALVVLGFAACMSAPLFGLAPPVEAQVPPLSVAGLLAVLLGLAAFGAGVALLYSAALYYAMEVGSAQVEAGGMHEAMIGVGYTLGPLCGLVPALGSNLGWIGDKQSSAWMLGLTVLGCGAGFVLAGWRGRVARNRA